MPLTLDGCDELFASLLAGGSAPSKQKIINQLLSACDVINVTMGRGDMYWRARKSPQSGFGRTANVWHPKPDLARAGRMNDAGVPALYLSTDVETALSEIHVAEGDHVHCTAYMAAPGKTFRANAIGEVEHLVRTGYLKFAGRDPDGAMLRMIQSEPYEKARVWAYIDAFFARVLADVHARESGYELTRMVSKLAFRKSGARAMFYPSVRSDIGMNLGVQAKIAADVFQPVASYVLRIDKVRQFNFNDVYFTRHASGIDKNGRFTWMANTEQGKLVVFNATKEEYETQLKQDPNMQGGPIPIG